MNGRLVKRMLDVGIAGGVLGLSAPAMLGIALLIRLDSPGPVLFRQTRVGRDGVPFQLYKFRSMRPNAGGPSLTQAGDARVTRVGRRLRAWKLDELPQLVQVLRGEMSLVGPRPETPDHVALYSPQQRRVLSVRPGLTSRASIEYRHEERLLAAVADPERLYREEILPHKLALDLIYVEQPGLREDLRILGRTLLAVLRG